MLEDGFAVIGLSKSNTSITHHSYRHILYDVTDLKFESFLGELVAQLDSITVGIYCAGIGAKFDAENLEFETKVFQVNLMSAVTATNIIVKKMREQGYGHFIGLSSIADALTSTAAPSYAASKAGVSRYWEGLGLALASSNVKISNVRFGFVDTKMAKAPSKPMLIDSKTAAIFIRDVIRRPRIRASKPYVMSLWAHLLGLLSRIRFFGR
ncbi:hypothetical protein AZI85_14490 [Bdellovibrio bacteriovorus]|uniref:Short-chain dehydrogenase n=2 Tax=Bdellovibrio bacteriovorus TaxID=959 RepID=A0A150WV39_BDEBC|nr:hypothetical protein AZI85_14490 [Bdellovibrio bacteriovorus]